MPVDEVPDVTTEMMGLYKTLADAGGDFERVLPEIDVFLQKYPHYPEALVFKARSLISLDRNDEALTCLRMASRAGGFRLVASFDEAEVYVYNGGKEEAIHAYCESLKDSAIQLQNSIDSCLMYYGPESRAKVEELTKKVLVDFLRDGNPDSFRSLAADLLEIRQ